MKKTILVVDDSRTMRFLVKSALSSEGFDVIEADNGKDALNKLGICGADIVVTDFDMPVMDGIELTKRMRLDQKLRKIPVVFLSSKDEKNEVFQLGVMYWLMKPFTPKALIDVINKLLGKASAAQPVPKPKSPAAVA